MDSDSSAPIAFWAVLSCALAFSSAWIGVEGKRSRAALLGTVFGAAQIPALVFALAYSYYGRIVGPMTVPALIVIGLVCATVSGSAAIFLRRKAFQIVLVAAGAPLLLVFVYFGGFFLLPVFAFVVTLIAITWSVASSFHRKRPPDAPRPEPPGKSAPEQR